MAITGESNDSASGSSTLAPSNPYVLHPFQGDIFPGTSAGAKLFDRATSGPDEDKRLTLDLDDAIEIKSRLLKAQQDFAWSTLTTVPTNYASDGTPSNFVDLVLNPEAVALSDVQFSAAVTWSKSNIDFSNRTCSTMEVSKIAPSTVDADRPQFQRRVRSEMIAAWVRNNFQESALDSLELQSSKYRWSVRLDEGGGVRLDGPTMIKLILDTISPSSVVGTDNLRKSIQGTRLPKFGYDVVKAMESIERDFKEIRRRNETYDSLRLHCFDCLKSAKNTRFLRWVDRVEEDIRANTGEYKGFDAARLISAAKTQYRNMNEDKTWDKVDPANAQMLALLTALKKTTAASASGDGGGSGGSNNGGGGGASRPSGYQVDDWRKKKTTATVVHNNKTWWWCPHHEGDGLYVRHPPEDHDKARAASAAKKKGGTYDYRSPDPLNSKSSAHTVDGGDKKKKDDTDGDSAVGNLVINDNLKTVLTTYGLSNSDIDGVYVACGLKD